MPTKILPRVIITYGACPRGGGRRPGFEASTCNVEEDGRLQCIAIATSVRVTGSADKRMGPRSG